MEGGINLFSYSINRPNSLSDSFGLISGGFAFSNYPGEEGFFKDRAGGRNNPNVGDGDSGKELLDHLKKISSSCCIDSYLIAGHGWAGRRGPGVPSSGVPEEGFLQNKSGRRTGSNARDINDLIANIGNGSIKFCSGCTISIYACKISSQFIQSLSAATGCKVTAAGGACKLGSSGWETGRRTIQDPSYESNNFWQSTNGNPPVPIGSIFSP